MAAFRRHLVESGHMLEVFIPICNLHVLYDIEIVY